MEIVHKFELSEPQFYRLFLDLQNAVVPKRLTKQEIDLMVIICCKPMNWILDSKKSKHGRSKKYELANELGIKSQGIYALLLSLEAKGYLIKEDDDFLYLPKPLNSFRKAVKYSIERKTPLEFDYIFRFKVE